MPSRNDGCSDLLAPFHARREAVKRQREERVNVPA
jgi:hypothetical protein